MCVAALGVALGAKAGTAAASTLGLSAIGTAISGVSAVFGIMQAQSQAAFARAQASANTRNQQRQVQFDREQQMLQHVGDVRAQQAANLAAEQNMFYARMGQNRQQVAEQFRIKEARDRMAFKMQKIYAKQIGTVGSVLAAGRSGQSIGLLTRDAERQAGFAAAQEQATVRSTIQQAGNQMDLARINAQSSINRTASAVPAPVRAPQFSPQVSGVGGLPESQLGIPAYQFT
jgi:hypothetical protein|tara:strand:- start:1777 stop:2469 length:693 start_codon:yes stop_codon:yes gene_type:complete